MATRGRSDESPDRRGGRYLRQTDMGGCGQRREPYSVLSCPERILWTGCCNSSAGDPLCSNDLAGLFIDVRLEV